jgi:hypothetical protein
VALNPTQVAQAAKDHADDQYRNSLACKFTQTDLNAAAQATDDWIEANQAAYNTALPATFRNNANITEKTAMFNWVANRRLRG